MIAAEWENVKTYTNANVFHWCTTFLCSEVACVRKKLLTVGCFSACKSSCIKKMHTVIIGGFILLKARLWKVSNEVQASWMQLKIEGW